MKKCEYLPGTIIPGNCKNSAETRIILDSVFAAGGLVLSQVAALGGMQNYTVQNWVKRGFCSPPIGKKYTQRQFCRLVIINMLKDSLTIPDITALLSYINGKLEDESDDLINDDVLYLYFTELTCTLNSCDSSRIEAVVEEVTANYVEPVKGAADRLRSVLTVMYYAYSSSMLRRTACDLMQAIEN